MNDSLEDIIGSDYTLVNCGAGIKVLNWKDTDGGHSMIFVARDIYEIVSIVKNRLRVFRERSLPLPRNL